jgi:hypothetical protein
MSIISKIIGLTFMVVLIALLLRRANGVTAVSKALSGLYASSVGALAKL